jgi:hypothetical protein
MRYSDARIRALVGHEQSMERPKLALAIAQLTFRLGRANMVLAPQRRQFYLFLTLAEARSLVVGEAIITKRAADPLLVFF